jgi:hypothetical protein
MEYRFYNDITDTLGQLAIDCYNEGETELAAEFVDDLSRLGRIYVECRLEDFGGRANLPTWCAWFLSAWPEADSRDGTLALQLADSIPDDQWCPPWMKWRTTAFAQLRCGHYQEAIEAMDKSMKLAEQDQRPERGIDLLVLAMANWQLGNEPEAKIWYGRAAELMDQPDYMKNKMDRNSKSYPVHYQTSRRNFWESRWDFFERHFRAEVQTLMENRALEVSR